MAKEEPRPELINLDDPHYMDLLKEMHPVDVAENLRFTPVLRVREVLRLLPDEKTAEVIAELPSDLQVKLFESMRLQAVSGIISEMFTDDAADILGQISSSRLREIMDTLDPESAADISTLLRYPEDTAGGIMQTEFIAVPDHFSLGEAVEWLRKESVEAGALFYVYVVDEDARLRGVVEIRDLLFKSPDTLVRDVMNREVRCVSVHADQEAIASLFWNYHYVALPVVDDFQRLRGVVTSDDVMEVMQEEATEDMQRMVGLSGEEMIDTPWGTSVRNRLPWLMLNLATAFMAGAVVSAFESTIAQYAVLAVFLPIIAGQAGNAGTQTLTILVRALALEEVRFREQRKILTKEILIGLLTGIVTGVVVGAISWIWKGNVMLGVVAFLAMVLNLVCAAVAGVLIPLGLRAMKVDPALASAIMLTTVTDVVGFFIFLGLASIGLYYFPVG